MVDFCRRSHRWRIAAWRRRVREVAHAAVFSSVGRFAAMVYPRAQPAREFHRTVEVPAFTQPSHGTRWSSPRRTEKVFYYPSPTFDFPRCFQVATIVCHSDCGADKTDLCLPEWVYEKIQGAGIWLAS
jgi:hypothetical protein